MNRDELIGEVIHVARLETEDDSWISLHLTHSDALEKLHAVAEAWDIGDLDSPTEILFWSVTSLPVMSSEEAAEYPETETLAQLPHDPHGHLLSTFKMLVMKDVTGGLSAEELAGDLNLPLEEAARRLAELAKSGTVRELSPGRYRAPASARWSER